ncbi:MAG: preprotein translocase subunit YajC [Planctomycetes bacterium]|nr:preprotein translocase subunit YajC [Planctomycetota bacterium]
MPSTSIFIPCPLSPASGLTAAGTARMPQRPERVEAPSGDAGGTAGGNAGGTMVAPDPANPANPNQPNGGAPGFANDIFIYMALFVGLMLFLSFRKESKARKQQQQMLASIKQGDRVVTSSGIHGVVHRLDDGTVTLLLDTAQVRFERSSIVRVVRDPAAQPATKSA